MSGWKTWAAGIGMILSGIAGLLVGFSGDGEINLEANLALITGGLGLIGVGHKIDKAA